MTLEAVLEEVGTFGCDLVEITGGEPLLQAEALDLMRVLLGRGYEVLVETGGSLPIDAVPEGVRRIVDVKCPGSGESARNHWANLEVLRAGDEVKFVIADRTDYEWAAAQVRARTELRRVPVLFSPVHETLHAGTLADWVLADRLPVRVQVQMHKILWPGVARGV